ncbi:MAG: hypothetical protein ACR2QA_06745 [Solirubrobacteraceae bacterium]
MYQFRVGLRAGFVSLCMLVGVMGLGTATASAAPAPAAGSFPLQVSAGYADQVDNRPSQGTFPTPFAGAPGVIFDGCDPATCKFDGGVVRLFNPGSTPATVDRVTIAYSTCVFDNFNRNVSIPAGGSLELAQTASNGGNGCPTNATTGGGTVTAPSSMDGSDIGINGADLSSGTCTPDGLIPMVHVTIGGTTSTFADKGQILNTGGFDKARCPMPSTNNESHQFTPLGTLTRSGTFSCTATALELLGASVSVANPADTPCKTDTAHLVNATVGQGTVLAPTNGTGTGGTTATPTSTDLITTLLNTLNSLFGGSGGGLFSLGNIAGTGTSGIGGTGIGTSALTGPLLTADVANASTKLIQPGSLPAAGDGATANASLANVKLGGIGGVVGGAVGSALTIQAASSTQNVRCVNSPNGTLTPRFTGSSKVVGLSVNGATPSGTITTPETINVLGIATIFLNREITTTNNGVVTHTRRAVEVDLGGPTNGTPLAIVGQSSVDTTGNPCAVTSQP